MSYTYWHPRHHVYHFDVDAVEKLSYKAFRPTFCSAWLGAMIAIGTTYFFLSSNRKSKLFKLQLFCILSAILYNISEIAFEIFFFYDGMLNRSKKGMNWTIAAIWLSFGLSLDHLVPLFADFTLLFRISAFYPFPIYSKRIRFYIFLPFILLNIFRIILCILIFISSICADLINLQWFNGSSYPDSVPPNWVLLAQEYLVITELILSSIFCFLASSILLYKAYKLSKSHLSATQNQHNIKRRMQFFIEALLMCFIPPFLLNITGVIQLLGPFEAYTYFKEIQTCNVNISVICSILANAWPRIRDGLTKEAQKETKPNVTQARGNADQ